MSGGQMVSGGQQMVSSSEIQCSGEMQMQGEELDRVCMGIYNSSGNDPTMVIGNFKMELAEKMQQLSNPVNTELKLEAMQKMYAQCELLIKSYTQY